MIKKSASYVILGLAMLALLNFVSFLSLAIMNKLISQERYKHYLEMPNFQDEPSKSKQVFLDFEGSSSEYTPFMAWKRKPYKSETLNIDSLGFRIHEHDKTHLNDKSKQVYFFGGSTMWGMGVDDNNTIPALWSQRNPSFKVYNFGETGYNSRQNLETLINLITSGRKIDIAVFYEGYNDIVPAYSKKEYFNTHSQVDYLRQSTSKQISLYRKVFYENSFLLLNRFKQFYDSYNGSLEKDCQRFKTEMLAQESKTLWRLAKNMVEKRGGKFVLILQPTAAIGHPNLTHLEKRKESIEYKKYAKGLECVYPEFQEFCKDVENKSWAYDFTDIFDGKEYYYFTSCHVTSNGNRKLVARLDSVLKSI